MVDHIAPGFVLLELDEHDHFAPLTSNPYGELIEAIEEAERLCVHHELTGGIRFSKAAIEAAHSKPEGA